MLDAYSIKSVENDKCTNCTTTFSTTLVVLCNKTRITALPAEMFLHSRNGFEFDPSQDNNHIRQKIIDDQQDSNDSFVHVCWQILQRLFHTTIQRSEDLLVDKNTRYTYKKAINTYTKARLSKHFKVHTLFCLHFKVTQNFLAKSVFLEILQSQESKESVIDLYCEHHILYIKCSNSNNFMCKFVCL